MRLFCDKKPHAGANCSLPRGYAAFSFSSTGYSAATHPSKPPRKANTRGYPACLRICATRALDPSFGQVQYVMIVEARSISCKCLSTSFEGTRIAPGIFRLDSAQAVGFRLSRKTMGSPAKTRAFTSSGEILSDAILQLPLSELSSRI